MIIDQMILDKVAAQKSTYQDDKSTEKPVRSIVKAISWRIVGTLDTLIVSYLLTGEMALATSIASIDFVTKMILYFFHERIWNRIKWGK
ncbi:DUF2061 domain-containing protein [Aquimarina muelleri]|uniref:DUF2061 domain-containing protein n=1 Tax=Aquimarina muelleri TaxID=279356 RepID=A0A918N2W3_9FLAO|nr:DUF2061 domain-containing protein [Aquimarina muelleri]MCX2762622.1 DUF2061 domain-containing protein [Aquimarina muelleri]GGX06005.1 hypothetical protein GCM10007384_04640 [Aquimarina muelleri]